MAAVAAIRVYARAADGKPIVIDVPPGRLTTEYVDKARAAGGTNIEICALGADGLAVSRARVRG